MTKGIKELLASCVLAGLASPMAIANPGTVEQAAREVAEAFATTLPMRVNQNLTLQTAVAGGRTVTMTAMFTYTKADLDVQLIQAGKTDAEAREMVRNSAKAGVCDQGPEGRAFIAMGGLVRYLYRFVDGTTYELVEISSCA